MAYRAKEGAAPMAKIIQNLVVLNLLSVVGVCSSGWSCYLSRCYYVSTDRLNRGTARTRCRSENADLVSISDENENNFVTSIWSVC